MLGAALGVGTESDALGVIIAVGGCFPGSAFDTGVTGAVGPPILPLGKFCPIDDGGALDSLTAGFDEEVLLVVIRGSAGVCKVSADFSGVSRV